MYKEGQKVDLYLDSIEGWVVGTLKENYGGDRWLIECSSCNVVRIVRDTEKRADGCGYIKDIPVTGVKENYSVEILLGDKFKGENGLRKLSRLLSKEPEKQELIYQELCKKQCLEGNDGTL